MSNSKNEQHITFSYDKYQGYSNKAISLLFDKLEKCFIEQQKIEELQEKLKDEYPGEHFCDCTNCHGTGAIPKEK